MINIDTWFFIKSPQLVKELKLQNISPDSIDFLETAKTITSKYFLMELDQLKDMKYLPPEEKERIIDFQLENILAELPIDNPLRIHFLNNEIKSSLKNVLIQEFPEIFWMR